MEDDFFKLFVGKRQGNSLIVQEMITVNIKDKSYGRSDPNMVKKMMKGGPLIFDFPKDGWSSLLLS